MGLFVLPIKDRPKENIQAAISNIELYLELIESQDKNYEYLLDSFAIGALKSALAQLKDK